MAALRANVALSFGLVTCTVAVHSAIEAKTRNKQVCAGTPAAPHDPVLINQRVHCATCGEIPFEQVAKAREVPDGLVLLTDTDLATIGEAAKAFATRLELAPHPPGEVEIGTAPGDKAYYLVPAKGHEAVYNVLSALLAKHPELAFCTRFTPRSAMGVYRVVAVEGLNGPVLLMQERIAGDKVKAAPEIVGPGLAHEQMIAMGEMILRKRGKASMVRPFRLDAYRDPSQDLIAALVAERAPLALTRGSSTDAPVAGTAALAQFQAMLDAEKPVRKPRARRAAAVKVPA